MKTIEEREQTKRAMYENQDQQRQKRDQEKRLDELERIRFNMRVQQDNVFDHATKEHEEQQKNQQKQEL